MIFFDRMFDVLFKNDMIIFFSGFLNLRFSVVLVLYPVFGFFPYLIIYLFEFKVHSAHEVELNDLSLVYESFRSKPKEYNGNENVYFESLS